LDAGATVEPLVSAAWLIDGSTLLAASAAPNPSISRRVVDMIDFSNAWRGPRMKDTTQLFLIPREFNVPICDCHAN
jgi:hypothetical protein